MNRKLVFQLGVIVLGLGVVTVISGWLTEGADASTPVFAGIVLIVLGFAVISSGRIGPQGRGGRKSHD